MKKLTLDAKGNEMDLKTKLMMQRLNFYANEARREGRIAFIGLTFTIFWLLVFMSFCLGKMMGL